MWLATKVIGIGIVDILCIVIIEIGNLLHLRERFLSKRPGANILAATYSQQSCLLLLVGAIVVTAVEG